MVLCCAACNYLWSKIHLLTVTKKALYWPAALMPLFHPLPQWFCKAMLWRSLLPERGCVTVMEDKIGRIQIMQSWAELSRCCKCESAICCKTAPNITNQFPKLCARQTWIFKAYSYTSCNGCNECQIQTNLLSLWHSQHTPTSPTNIIIIKIILYLFAVRQTSIYICPFHSYISSRQQMDVVDFYHVLAIVTEVAGLV